MRRVIVSLIAVLALTAFAPAPLPRPQRGADKDEISLRTFQGTWRVVSLRASLRDGNHVPTEWSITHIRIRDNAWIFLEGNTTNSTCVIVIDNQKKPATIDFHDGSVVRDKPNGVGIIRRNRDVVEILYAFNWATRAVSFEQPPDSQCVLTLQRQR